MKPLIIYHANCTDGFGAAYCAWLEFGDQAEYFPAHYGVKILDEVEVINRDVYILDFSFDALVTGEIIELADHVTWLDHHKTAFEAWCEEERQLYVDETEYTHIVLDNNKSGTMLAWEYFSGGQPAPDWVRWIDDRDRWQFKLADSKAFHAGMSARRPWTFEQWHDMAQTGEFTWPVIAEGNTLLGAQKAQVKSSAKHARKCRLHFNVGQHGDDSFSNVSVSNGYYRGFDGLAVNTNVHMSEVGHELANQSGSYGLVWYLGSDNLAKVSLRSNGDYDVSAIAKQFGGGGHKNAAGFSLPITTLLEWLR